MNIGTTIEAIHSASPTAIIPIFLYFHPIAASTKATNARIRNMTLRLMLMISRSSLKLIAPIIGPRNAHLRQSLRQNECFVRPR